MQELVRDIQDYIDRPSPVLWFVLGAFLLILMIINRVGEGMPYLDLNATELGIVLGLVFAALILGRRDRPRSKNNTAVFLTVCTLFATHGLWWYPFWEIIARAFENQIGELFDQTFYIRRLFIGQGGFAFGGLILISAILCWPIWMLTHSRVARTACVLAGPIAAVQYVGGGSSWPWHTRIPGLIERVFHAMDHPIFFWYVIVFLPLTILAYISRVSTKEGVCVNCNYSLEGLRDVSTCPECGTYPFYKRKSDPQAALKNLVD